MLAIKFKPVGKKNQLTYRVVTTEKRSKLRGAFVEDIGWFNPRDKSYHVNKERVLYWISAGAQPTETVHNLLVRSGVMHGAKIAVHKKSKRTQESDEPKTTTTVESTEATASVPIEAPVAEVSSPVEDEVVEPSKKEGEQIQKEEEATEEPKS